MLFTVVPCGVIVLLAGHCGSIADSGLCGSGTLRDVHVRAFSSDIVHAGGVFDDFPTSTSKVLDARFLSLTVMHSRRPKQGCGHWSWSHVSCPVSAEEGPDHVQPHYSAAQGGASVLKSEIFRFGRPADARRRDEGQEVVL